MLRTALYTFPDAEPTALLQACGKHCTSDKMALTFAWVTILCRLIARLPCERHVRAVAGAAKLEDFDDRLLLMGARKACCCKQASLNTLHSPEKFHICADASGMAAGRLCCRSGS